MAIINIEILINNHTLYNYYTNFNIDKIKKSVRKYMIKGKGENKLHYLTGQVASNVKDPTYFKYCSQCLKEDIEEYGPFWRTYHQLPSVFICLKHCIYLEDSTFHFRHLDSKFADLSQNNCLSTGNRNENSLTRVNIDLIRFFAEESYKITTKDYNFDQTRLLEIYRYLLNEKGYLKTNGTVNQIELGEDFIRFYGVEFLRLMQSLPSGRDGKCWLRAITRKHRRSFHPIRHLLLIRFLGHSVDTIYQCVSVPYKPFGEEPYLCLNPAANHYLKPVITDLKVTTCYDTKRPVGTFSCSCGFIYSRRGPDQIPEDKMKIGRIKQFGDVWFEKLNHLINIEKLSYRATARILKVDTKTIIKYANKEVPLIQEIEVESNIDLKNQWQELKCDYPELSRTELRMKNASLYMRLYRSERDWLFNNSPQIIIKENENKRVNWEERDFLILEEVKNAVIELGRSDKPVRVTLTIIGKAINRLSLLEKKLDKLPLTKEYIESVTESVEEFQKRRIKWAVDQLYNEDLSLWKVKRFAGIRESFYSKFDSEINHIIEIKLSNQNVLIEYTE